MGFRFRKSIKMGPLRFTLSKSGVSASVGVKGYRVTKTANGRVRRTASIPGTGISYVTETGGQHGKAARAPAHPAPSAPPPKVSHLRERCSGPSSSLKNRLSILALVLLVAAFLVFTYFGFFVPANISRARAQTPVPSSAPAQASMVTLVSLTPKPAPEPTPTPTPAPVYTYVANTNTKKFHKPGCSSVSSMKDKNKAVYETTRSEMISMGFEPCAKCKP